MVTLSDMLAQAAKDHRDAHGGRHAKRFGLSKWCYAQLVKELDPAAHLAMHRGRTFHGVEVHTFSSCTDHRVVPVAIIVSCCGVISEV